LQKYADSAKFQKDYSYLQGYETLKMGGGIPWYLLLCLCCFGRP